MSFFRTIKSSIYDPEFYRTLSSKSFGSSFKYLTLLVLFFSLVYTVVFSSTFLPGFVKLMNGADEVITEVIPADLVVKVENGKATSNVAEPSFIPFPERWEKEKQEFQVDNLAVIETSASFSLERFREHRAYVGIFGDAFAIHSKEAEIRVYPLDTASESFELSRESALSIVDKLSPFMKVFIIVLPIFVLIFLFVSVMLGTLLALLLVTFVVWLVLHYRSMDLGYWRAFQAGIHAITLILIVDYLLEILLRIHIPFLWGVVIYALAAAAVVLVNTSRGASQP